MGKYIFLQCKRMARILPWVLGAALILAAVLGLLFSSLLEQDAEKSQTLKIGLVGTAEDPILEMGLTALQTIDDSRYSVQLMDYTESDAYRALERGEIAAYVVIPENFMEEAMHGRFLPLQYVGTTGSAGLVPLFKEEFTRVVGNILIEARKGVYGLAEALEHRTGTGTLMDQMAMDYVQYVLQRNQAYTVQQLGIGDGLALTEYLLCGLLVLLLLLLCLPFAPLLIRKDSSLSRLLASRGLGIARQTLCEFLAYFSAILALSALVIATVRMLLPQHALGSLTWLHTVPVAFAVSGISYLLYQLTHDMISGVLLQFFVFLSLAFVSGCMYPVYFFPQRIQTVAQYLPTGIARSMLACGVMGTDVGTELLRLLLYGVAALATAILLRRIALRNAGR